MDTGEDDFRSELIDLTDLDLTELDALPVGVLVAALRRLDRRAAAPGDQYAGFESALDGDD
ncbi:MULTISPECIES: FxSxx-COOH cyclophane-containing RiPP peptide [unclassified Micromonospora]|uniref:FxSxx-COOH cyclophane-containing RiPP peptide n=1 Tax=unclassified Micromonospora TaxID=2617518 RepID=UPI002E24381E|nr:FxSxx-COOH protein [Micromonospora sp. NBC_00858]